MRPITFTVFGALRVCHGEVPRDVPGRRERAVLGVLLSQRERWVSADRLVLEVWGEEAGPSARGSLQVAVSRLRTVLEPERGPGEEARVLVSSANGYRLQVDGEQVDADRFSALVTRAHDLTAAGAYDDALAALDEASGLRTGAPYPESSDSDLVAAEVLRLEELWWSLLELQATCHLATGRPALVVGPLRSLVAEHPFRESAWRSLALALYRTGRQAEALDTVREASSRLADELGLDPSADLRRLEQDLLVQADSLDPVPSTGPASATGPDSAAGPSATSDGVTMVGREHALARASAGVDALLRDGRGSTLVLTGEAGIGKTTLVGLVAQRAELAGARVHWGRCHEADVSPAYWPWVAVVRGLDGAGRSPEVAALLSADTVRSSDHAESAALRTYDAVCRLLAEESRERPLVVVLEDLHWADSASLQLLAHAAETLAGSRVLLVATVRVPETAPPGLAACLAALARASATRLHLEGLTEPDVHTLVGTLTAGRVDDELARVVAERTDGNPFFVIELVRLLSAESRLDARGAREVAVPDGVEDVLRLRLGRLPDAVRSSLAVASVLGREFEVEALASVTGDPVDVVLDRLEVALEARIVEESESAGHFRFAHALVRETLYGALSRARRARVHAACGEALEPSLGTRPDRVAEVAHHLVLGSQARPELAPSAVALAVEAAQLAEGRGAFDRARTHWEQALTADELAREPSGRRRYGVLLGLGRARGLQGDIAGSRAALDEAVALAADAGDVERVARAATSFRGAGVWHWREFGTSDPAMQRVLRHCLEQLPEGALQARVLASLAMELMYEWRSLEAEPFSRRSMEVARSVGDPVLLAEVAALRELFLFGRPGATAERKALAEELLGLDLGLEYELYTRFGAACALLQEGDAEAADRQMTRCGELARRLRHSGADVPLAWWRFYRAMAREDRGAAAVLLEQAEERHRRSSIVAVDDVATGARLRMAGSSAEVPEDLRDFARDHANPAFRAFIGSVLVDVGEAEAGAGLLGDPVPDGAWDYASTFGDCLRVYVLAEAGVTGRLPEALRRIEPWAEEFAGYGSTETLGSVAFFVGRGHEALGDVERARTAYGTAVEANRRGGVVLWQRRAEERLSGLRTPSAPARR